MTYREKLRRYREGTLDEETRRQVEQDVERHEAIGEYLFETSEIPELEEILEKEPEQGENKEGGEDGRRPGEDTFVTLVNQSIRRAFLRLGVATLAAAVIVILLLQFGLPRMVSLFYYNPGRTVEIPGDISKESGGSDTAQAENQMTLDMAVYSELFLPCNERGYVDVEDKGYGVYDISIAQTISYNGSFTSVSGEIVRGDLKLYDPNVLREPTGNCFAWFQGPADTTKSLEEGLPEEYNMCAAGKREDALQTIEDLDDQELYVGYVTLNRMMDYESFKAYLDEQDVINPWCAVKTGESEGDMFRANNLGFNCKFSASTPMYWDMAKYPDLLMYSEYSRLAGGQEGSESDYWDEQDAKMQSEDAMVVHFTSMLRYLADQDAFMNMMGKEQEAQELRQAADYVEEKGITVYGFAAVMNRETMLQLFDQDEVYEIYVERLK